MFRTIEVLASPSGLLAFTGLMMSKGDESDGKASEGAGNREIIRQAELQVEEMNKRFALLLAEKEARKGLHPLLAEMEKSIKQGLRELSRIPTTPGDA